MNRVDGLSFQSKPDLLHKYIYVFIYIFVYRIMHKQESTRATLHTTTAVTMFNGGIKVRPNA